MDTHLLGKRSVRTTLLAGQCDFFVGLPNDEDFLGKRIIFSKTIFSVGYALVTPVSAKPTILKGQRIGVQFNSGPQNLLAPRDDISTATFIEPKKAMERSPPSRSTRRRSGHPPRPT